MRSYSRPIVSLVVALMIAGAPRTGRADPFYQLVGTKSLAMGGAHRGLGTNNDALILNPAGMAIARRYSSQVQYGYNTGDHISRLLVSAVDSSTSPVAAGLAYTREWGNPSGVDIGMNRIYLGLAYALVPGIAFGITGQNARGSYLDHEVRHKENNFNGTAGAMLSLGQRIGLGVVYENFVHLKDDAMMPSTLGLGASANIFLATLVADYVIDMRPHQKRAKTFGVGAEVLMMQHLAFRGGYRMGHETSARTGPLYKYVTGGVGLVSNQAGVELSAERSIERTGAWQVVAGLNYGL